MSTPSVWTQLRYILGGYPNTAAEWAARVQCADVTRQELLMLDAWLKADPHHAEEYARVNKIGHLGLKLREHPEELTRLQGYQRLRESERQIKQSRSWQGQWQWAAPTLAASAVIAITMAYWLYTQSTGRYVVGHGEQQNVTLSDGSRMVVNTDSEVKVLYAESARIITLPRGEAFFEVAKNPARPFIVRTGDIEVHAVGTKFSVRREGADTEVVVTEGRVRVSRMDDEGKQPVELTMGTRLRIAAQAPLTQPTTVDAAAATAWAEGTVAFDDAPLNQVVQEVNRYTPKKFIIVEPQLNQIRLTGRFRVGDMESVKFALKDRFKIQTVESNEDIKLF